MGQFIKSEAKKKADGIRTKGEEEFNNEVHRIITEQKDKIRQEYDKKTKQVETQFAIAKSLAINKQRLDKIKARQDVMAKVAEDVKQKLKQDMKDTSKTKNLITDLIVQGLLMLLENEVVVRCRECDVKTVEDCLQPAAKMYEDKVKNETGATKTCKLSIDKTQYLDPTCLAG